MTVPVPPSEVFDFVLDLHRYQLADHKVRKVGRIERTGDTGTARFSSRIRGIPGPPATYPFTVSPSRLWIGTPKTGPTRFVLTFEATFDCEETEAGTVVLHREAYGFKRPWRWLAEPLLGRWLEADTAKEMDRFHELLTTRP